MSPYIITQELLNFAKLLERKKKKWAPSENFFDDEPAAEHRWHDELIVEHLKNNEIEVKKWKSDEFDKNEIQQEQSDNNKAFLSAISTDNAYSDYFSEDKKLVVKFINDKEQDYEENNQFVHRLALFILLTEYPENWHDLLEAAYELLCLTLQSILNRINNSNTKIVYPPCWTEKIFQLENDIPPDACKGIIFGIDPIPNSKYAKYASGYAFAFDVPISLNEQGKNFPACSTNGLTNSYGFTNLIDWNDSNTLKEHLLIKHGIALVNFIRTIFYKPDTQSDPNSGSNNEFRSGWAVYNKAWLTWFRNKYPNDFSERVLIFQNERHIFDKYSYHHAFIGSDGVLELLHEVPRCSHPSYISARDGHCPLRNIKTKYATMKDCDNIDIRITNNSVYELGRYFERFDKEHKIIDCIGCTYCQTNVGDNDEGNIVESSAI